MRPENKKWRWENSPKIKAWIYRDSKRVYIGPYSMGAIGNPMAVRFYQSFDRQTVYVSPCKPGMPETLLTAPENPRLFTKRKFETGDRDVFEAMMKIKQHQKIACDTERYFVVYGCKCNMRDGSPAIAFHADLKDED